MPANTKPIFITSANKGIVTGVRLSTTNSTRDLSNTTGAQLLFSAGTNGSRVEAIDFVHASSGQTAVNSTSVNTVFRLFLCNSTTGSNPRLIKELYVPGGTAASATAIGTTSTITFTTPLFLAPEQTLFVTMSQAQNGGAYYDITVYGGDY